MQDKIPRGCAMWAYWSGRGHGGAVKGSFAHPSGALARLMFFTTTAARRWPVSGRHGLLPVSVAGWTSMYRFFGGAAVGTLTSLRTTAAVPYVRRAAQQ